MLDYEELFSLSPFSLPQAEKAVLFAQWITELTHHHVRNCPEYRNILAALSLMEARFEPETVPFLPVRLFKELELLSIQRDEVFKVMTSSGTTGQAVSKIFLDKATAAVQQKALVKIVTSFTEAGRLPMLIIDSPSVIKNRQTFSARGAGILGFSIFGADRTYALNDNMQLDAEAVRAFLDKHRGKKIFLFGFTFMIWQHFYKALLEYNKTNVPFDLQGSILIHGGGWKKLQNEAVSPIVFKEKLRDVCGLDTVCDYYGMVEQTGCIYMECEHGNLHASVFSDVIMRRSEDFHPCDIGESGIIQVLSLLPTSYPGHSLLTEDCGTILGIDDCPCGRKGKYFRIHGRLAAAEIRGCSDTYATPV